MITRVLWSLGLALVLAPAAHAATPGNRTYVGQDIFVAEGEQVHNATCLFCSVQVEGELTGHVLVLFGNLNISGRVQHNATVLGGNAVMDADSRIDGDALILFGNAVYESDESISGSAVVVGGHRSSFSRLADHRRRVSLSPTLSATLVVFVILLLSLLFHTARRRAVSVS